MYVNNITTLVIPIIKQLVNFTTIIVTNYLVVKFTRCFIKLSDVSDFNCSKSSNQYLVKVTTDLVHHGQSDTQI